VDELNLYKISLRLFLSLAIGVLFGIERDMTRLSAHEGEDVHFGGIRTFALIGLLGGLLAYTGTLLSHPVYIYGFIAVAIFVIASYVVEHRSGGNLGMTTEFSALLAYTLGALSVLGRLEIVVSAAVISLFLLSQKKPIQTFSARLRPVELLASLKFALVLLVIFPFLKGIEPVYWGSLKIIDPFQIWKMVVLISSISYLGYFLTRVLGQERGDLISGLLGGLASSTAVTYAMASKNQTAKGEEATRVLTTSVLLANAVSFVRVLVILAVLNLPLVFSMWIPVAVMCAVCLFPSFYLMWASNHSQRGPKTELALESPFTLKPALIFGFLYALIVFFVQLAKERVGDIGIYLLSVISGFPDVDPIAVTLAGLTGPHIALKVGSFSLVLALSSNLVFKSMIARTGGKRFGWRITFILMASATAGILVSILQFVL